MRKIRFYDVAINQDFKWGNVEGKNHFIKLTEDSAQRQDGQLCRFAEKCIIYPFMSPISLKPGYIKYMRQTYE